MTAELSIPITLNGTGADLKAIPVSQEDYYASIGGNSVVDTYPAGGSLYYGALTTTASGGTSIGSHTDTQYLQAIGTHPGSSLSVGTTTTTLYQHSTEATTFPTAYRPVAFDASGDIYEMDSDAFLSWGTRLLEQNLSQTHKGNFRIGSSSPGSYWETYESSIFLDKLQGASTVNYNLYRKIDDTDNGVTSPPTYQMQLNGAGTADLKEMSWTAANNCSRLAMAHAQQRTGLGDYLLLPSSQTPAGNGETGTWVSRGTALDTRNTTENFQYTTQLYTSSQYSTQYTRVYSKQYTGISYADVPASFAGTRAAQFAGQRTFAANYAGQRTYSGQYGGSRNYSAQYGGSRPNPVNFVGARGFAGTRNFAAQYTGQRSFSDQYSGSRNYTGNYVGPATSIYAATYTGTRAVSAQFVGTRVVGGQFAGQRTFSAQYLGTRITSPTAYAGQRSIPANFDGSRNYAGSYSGARVAPGSFSGARVLAQSFSGSRGISQTFTGTRSYLGLRTAVGDPQPFIGSVSVSANFDSNAIYSGSRQANFAGTRTAVTPKNYNGPMPLNFSVQSQFNRFDPSPTGEPVISQFTGWRTYGGVRTWQFLGTTVVTTPGQFAGPVAGNFASNATFLGVRSDVAYYQGTRSFNVADYFTGNAQNFSGARFFGGFFAGGRSFSNTYTGGRTVTGNFDGSRNYAGTYSGARVTDAQFTGTRVTETNFGGSRSYGSQFAGTRVSAPAAYAGVRVSAPAAYAGTRSFAGTRPYGGSRNYSALYAGSRLNDQPFSGSRTYSTTYTGNRTFAGTRSFADQYAGSRNYSAQYGGSRTYGTNFGGSRVFPANFAGNVAQTFAGTRPATYTRQYLGSYSSQYTGNYSSQFVNQFTGETLVAVSQVMETYTLYCRISE